MKKIIALALLLSFSIAFSQELYTEIKAKDINQERLNTAKKFAEAFIKKCENKDSSKFEGINIEENAEAGFYDLLSTKCPEMSRFYGNIEIIKLNAAYYYNNTKTVKPAEMYSFDIKTSELTNAKFLNILIYKEKNTIGGMLFSEEKPLGKALK